MSEREMTAKERQEFCNKCARKIDKMLFGLMEDAVDDRAMVSVLESVAYQATELLRGGV